MAYSKEQFEQLASPKGSAGIDMLRRLNRVNANINRMALETLGEITGKEVLEIGFGGGAFLSEAMALFPNSKFRGAEISDLAIEQAQKRFIDEISADKLSLHHYNGKELPFPNLIFDAVIAVNVIYFVSSLDAFLDDTKRILNAHGRCILAYSEESPDRVTRFEKERIEASLLAAGYERTRSISSRDKENGLFHCSVGFMRG